MIKHNKYNARTMQVGRHTFASIKEGNRFIELELLERAGLVSDIELQPRYDIVVGGRKIGFYKADFRYFDEDTQKTKVEDVKGYKKGNAYALFRLKKKLVEAIYNIKIVEI